ncbi:MAG TPA: CSLREA domain-containing protein, partial [Anaerolineales bacterium]|nr:CSLREA domain-containing protein [Anaerolineales bacterium]
MKKNIGRALYAFSILSVLFCQVGVTSVAAAATFVVNSTSDALDDNPGDGVCHTAAVECTLRAAVQEANASAGTDTISVPAGTYTLSVGASGEDAAAAGDLDITESVIITGAGMNGTVIDANSIDRAFQVISGTLTISDLTIQHGTANPGGGILVASQAAISRVGFNSNQSNSTLPDGQGGGVYIDAGASATITQSVFTGNSVNYGGGAVATAGGGASFSITDSIFDSNYGGFGGGALYPNGGASTVLRSTFTNNSATETTGPSGSVGGAIHSNATGGVLVENSTFVGNIAP